MVSTEERRLEGQDCTYRVSVQGVFAGKGFPNKRHSDVISHAFLQADIIRYADVAARGIQSYCNVPIVLKKSDLKAATAGQGLTVCSGYRDHSIPGRGILQ